MLFLMIIIQLAHATETSFTSDLICFKYTIGFNNDTISCANGRNIFVTSILHENDYDFYCRRFKQNGELDETALFDRKKRCVAMSMPKNEISSQCNGKKECKINLNLNRNFVNGTHSNCDFKSDRFRVNYECIHSDLNVKHMPRFDVCREEKFDNVKEGYITSPNYPLKYDGRKYCQMKLRVNNQRLEIYLIDMELEKRSLVTSNPTDYLEINNNGKLIETRAYELIFNETNDALLVFKTDNFFTKRGFFIYFRVVDLTLPTTSTHTTTFTNTIPTQKEHSIFSPTTTKILIQTSTLNLALLSSEGEYSTDESNQEPDFDLSSNTHLIESKEIKIDLEKNENEKKMSDEKSNLIIFILITVVIVLFLMVVALAFYKHGASKSHQKSQMRMILDSTHRNSSSTTSSTNTQYTDDSMIHLLFNTSNANQSVINPNQVYEDIVCNKQKPPLVPHKPPPSLPLEMKLIDNEKVQIKNEYCYVQIPNVEITQSIYLNDTPQTCIKPFQTQLDYQIANDDNSNYYKIPTNVPLDK